MVLEAEKKWALDSLKSGHVEEKRMISKRNSPAAEKKVSQRYKYLLAKSAQDAKNPSPEQTLMGHISRVVESMDVLDDLLTPSLISLFDGQVSPESWRLSIFCAAWLHDLGKANDHFQNMIRDKEFRQGIRHESLGIVVISEFLEDWLQRAWEPEPGWIKPAILFAISGHHLKFPDEKERGQKEVTFLGSHPDMAKFLEIGQKRLGLPSLPSLPDRTYSLSAFGGIGKNLLELQRKYDLEFSVSQKFFISSLKMMLMSADLAGSALPDKTQDLKDWIQKRLSATLKKEPLEQIVRTKLKEKHLYLFQEQVYQENGNTILLEAGCGSGKTVAAYLWAQKKGIGRRIFICYPTTATSSEGFSGYIQDPESRETLIQAKLIHSRAEIDYKLLGNMPSKTHEEEEMRMMKLEALETWPVPLIVCTANTVLGILQNGRRSIYSWPSLCRSIFVFDEIHSFCDTLFSHLLRFLEIFSSVPVLLMTATLPPERKEAIQKCCQKRGGLIVISGQKKREEAKRYILRRSSHEMAYQEVRQTIERNGKVLWVCNTVKKAIQQAKEYPSFPVQPYHSRYRYKDRLKRQRAVIDGFQVDQPAMLAVTTQVAEMSLDLSADLLITEYAPIPAMIQRMGRLNRYEEVPASPKLALFIEPENGLPYEKKKKKENAGTYWEKIDAWLDLLAGETPRSQEELSQAFFEVERKYKGLEKIAPAPQCQWIDSPWESKKQKISIMDEGYTTELIRQEDLDDHEGTPAELSIPMPFPKASEWQSWPNVGRFLVAPRGTIRYDPFWGAEYAEEINVCEMI